MSNNLQKPVIYLRNTDFDDNGYLKSNFFNKKIVIIFIHVNYCHYCNIAKPEFQNASYKYPKNNTVFCTIQADGIIPGEKECIKIFPKIIKNFRGYPEYSFFYNKKPLFIELHKRDADSILNMISTIAEK